MNTAPDGQITDIPAGSSTTPSAPLSAESFWAGTMRERDVVFSELRRFRPVSFHPPMERTLFPGATGFWAIVRHADIVQVSRNPEVFCSGKGVLFDDLPVEFLELVASFLATDGRRHNLLRRLVSGAFTPRRVAAIEGQIRAEARTIVAEAVSQGTCEAVSAIAMRLPLWTISQMIGIPTEHREEVYRAANTVVGTDDPDFVPAGGQALSVLVDAMVRLSSIGSELAAARRKDPQDDLMTALVTVEVDGERLTDQEIGAFTCLLAVAGNDTSRNSISHGLHAFATHPEQWALLTSDREERLGGAIEEIIRWATPVMDFRRTATVDTELGGQPIAAGDFVVLFYTSANRDEAVFVDPWQFDITRYPNEHLGFGGGGPHFCLGAQLARTQLRAVFSELARTVSSFETGDPEYLVGNFIHGVKRLECTFHPC